jgi:hypothetical protein
MSAGTRYCIQVEARTVGEDATTDKNCLKEPSVLKYKKRCFVDSRLSVSLSKPGIHLNHNEENAVYLSVLNINP